MSDLLVNKTYNCQYYGEVIKICIYTPQVDSTLLKTAAFAVAQLNWALVPDDANQKINLAVRSDSE